MTTESKLDAILTRVFNANLDPKAVSPVLFLASLYEELKAEKTADAAGRLLLGQNDVERLLFARLSMITEDSPVTYLIGCYRRTNEEARRVPARDKDFAQTVQDMLTHARDLIVSYTGHTLNPLMEGMFPRSDSHPKPASAFATQLIGDPTTGESLPNGFLEQFLTRFQEEGLDEMLGPVVLELSRSVRNMSPFGNFLPSLQAFFALARHAPAASVIVHHAQFCPPSINGRMFENDTLLGPFFKINCIPDIFGTGQPDVIDICFSDIQSRRAPDLQGSVTSIRNYLSQLIEGLFSVVHALLKAPGCREFVLQWIAKALTLNAGRGKMQIDELQNASHGFFCNLSAVMMKLSMPFMDPYDSKSARIDPSYVMGTEGARLDYTEETKLAASSEDSSKFIDVRNASRQDQARDMQILAERTELSRQSSAAGAGDTAMSDSMRSDTLNSSIASSSGGGGKPHFICECYFMTARTIHLGYNKVIAECMSNLQELQRRERSRQDLERMRSVWAAGPQAQETENHLAELKEAIAKQLQTRMCHDSVLQDPKMISPALCFARLTSTWMLRLVCAGYRHPGPLLQFPLPVPPLPEFAMLPEYLVDDMAELLLYVSRFCIQQLAGEQMAEIMDFLVTFLGAPLHIKNPYLRAKFVEVLRHWMPASAGYQGPPPNVTSLFEVSPLATKYLVPHLLRLYVDIEFTGSHNQFYDKFNIRHHIGELLEYLWTLQAHQASWVEMAVTEAEFYMRFVNMLINDAIYLLDESMKKLPEIREAEAAMDDMQAWNAQPQQQRQEREATLQQNRRIMQQDLQLANVHIRMMQYTTEKVFAPFLESEMVERVAAMLDYFLLYLAGPERKQLRIKDPEKYGFKPKELLTCITQIFLHLAAGDKAGVLAAAVARDERSYRHEVMLEVASLLRRQGLHPEAKVQQLEAFFGKVREVAEADKADEEMFDDIPDEFLDPIQCTLMKDPVVLPTSGQCLDRATIQRHLLSEQRDPFSRALLTPDMLEPNTELKERIEAWVKEQKSKK